MAIDSSSTDEITPLPNFNGSQPTIRILLFQVLPELPKPSKKVEGILLHCNSNSNEKFDTKGSIKVSKRRKKTKKTKKRKINGFIAFRTFYSRSIGDSTTQKQLSSKLGEAWGSEQNREIWNCYALRYNETGGLNDFITWLLKNLQGNIDCNQNRPARKKFVRQSDLFRNVEDVFIE